MDATFITQGNSGGIVMNINGDYHEHQIPSNFFHNLGHFIEQAISHVSLAIGSATGQSEIFEHLREAYSAIDAARTSDCLPCQPHTCRIATTQGVADACYTSAIQSIAQLRMMIVTIRMMEHHPTLCSSQHLPETLADLEKVLTLTERAVEAYHNTPLSKSLSRKISVEVGRCRRLLEDLLRNLSDWRRILSHIVLYLIQKIGQRDAVNTLDLKLRECHKSFAACLLALSRVAWPGSYRSTEALASLADMHHWLELESRTLQHIIVDTVTVVSHLGRDLPVPFIFCNSWEGFDFVITGFCRDSAGYGYIRRGDYKIWKPDDDTFIRPAEISVRLRPGMKVEMTIVVHELVEMKHRHEARRYSVRKKNETTAERVPDGEGSGAKATETGETAQQTEDKRVSEGIIANGDATRAKEEDAREPKERQGGTSRVGVIDDQPSPTSPVGVWVTPEATCSTPSPLPPPVPSGHRIIENVTEARLSECSTSLSQSSICVDADTLFKEDIIIAYVLCRTYLNHHRNNEKSPSVMGPTGAGKSSVCKFNIKHIISHADSIEKFVSMAMGSEASEGETVGHGLESYTQDVRVVRCRHPDDPRSYVFVDTPGFDDTNLSDADILLRIATWLTATYQKHIHLTAILYLHRISDNRMAGSALRNMELFQRLCGDAALPNVVLVTTMWDEVDEATGERREQELRDTFWASMIDSGSQIARFYHTPESAWKILGPYTGHFRPVKLQIQMELVDKGMPLSKTAAGSFLKSWLTVLSKQFKIFLLRFQKALRNASKQNDDQLDIIKRRTIATQIKIEKVNAQVNLLDDGSSVYSDTSSTSTALFSTAPSSPLRNRSYSIPLARESLVSLLSRGGMKRDEVKMLAKYGSPGSIPQPS
ncbi:hypothetical protein HWV62_21140 [Athelia sp. TMB]|nr:hypothetical protein HWV62_21140 [Athelia sp. TMB]